MKEEKEEGRCTREGGQLVQYLVIELYKEPYKELVQLY